MVVATPCRPKVEEQGVAVAHDHRQPYHRGPLRAALQERASELAIITGTIPFPRSPAMVRTAAPQPSPR